MQNYFKILPILILILFIVSCDNEDDNDTLCCAGSSIVDLASQTESLSTLVSALQLTGLDNALSASGSFTVLAPTNDAFDSFLSSANFTSLDEIPVDVLTNVLLNHVILGELESSSLTTGYSFTQAVSSASNTNMSIYINTDDGVSFNGVSTVTASDIVASNGVVHIVDGVIGLPSVVTFALADPNLSILVQALTAYDYPQSFVELLSIPSGSAPAPFTVFAPINSGFENLLSELSLSSLNDIDEETLSSVLSYHVLVGTNQLSATLSNGMVFTTALDQTIPGGGNLTYNDGDQGPGILTDNNERISNMVLLDVQADNGIIHAIDSVVLP